MDFKALKIFVQLVKSHSFSLAAEELSVTQPTISKSLKQLEDEIGLPLFHKGEAGRKREVKLTYMGEQLYEPYRVCRRVNILRDYPDDKIKIYP